MFCKMILFLVLILFSSKVDAYCGKTLFTYSSGTIKSPNYPSNYPSNTYCSYNIKVGSGNLVELTWKKFDVPGKMPYCSDADYVEVYIGCNYGTSFTKFCSTNMKSLPHKIYSRDGCIKVVLNSGSGTTKSGFLASYKTYSSGYSPFSSSCNSKTDLRGSSSQVIASPGWPNYYQKNQFPYDGKCEWDIEVGDSKKLVKLNFMDVDIKATGYSCSLYENVMVKGSKSVLTSSKTTRRYCSKSPFGLTTKYYELDVEMEINKYRYSSFNNRGFILGYVVYEDKDAATASNWGLIVGIVIVVLIVMIVAFICFRRYKRRQTTYRNAPVAYGTANTTTTTNVTQTVPPPVQKIYPVQYPPQAYPNSNVQSAGYPVYPTTDQAPPPYPGPPPSGIMYPQAAAPYPPPQNAQYPPPPNTAYPAPQNASYPPPQNAPYPPPQTFEKSSAPPM